MKNKTEEKNLNQNVVIKDSNTKISKEANKNLLKNIFYNLIIAILIMVYLMGINVSYGKFDSFTFEKIMQVMTTILLGISLILLEIAYKKESGKYLAHFIELIVVAAHSLSVSYVIKVYNLDFKLYMLTSSYIFSIYYVLKSILIYTKGKKEYLNSLSDIPEIVKKDEPVKKEATKRKKEDEEQEKNEESNKNELKNTKTSKEKLEKEGLFAHEHKKEKLPKGKKKTTTKTVKTDKISKSQNKVNKEALSKEKNKDEKSANKEKNEVIANVENKPKKRGRPKKIVTQEDESITENKTKKTVKKKSDSVENKDAKKDEGKKTLNDEEKVEEKPKRKRGRPRKEEVKLND